MADAPVVHIGENSPEKIAFELMQKIIGKEAKSMQLDRRWYLDTYAECLMTVQDPDGRLRGTHITHEQALDRLK